MDISLSLTTMIIFVPCSAALLSPSKAMALLSDPSPITAITLRVPLVPLSPPIMSRVFASPHASEIEVPVWPSTNMSCSLSWGFVNPVTVPNNRSSV